MNTSTTRHILTAATLASLAVAPAGLAQTSDALINKLLQKGILTEKEAKEIMAESSQTNSVPESKWKINAGIKNVTLFGDLRFRYEYRSADNALGSGSSDEDYYRERFRYAVRIGIRGELFDNFYYGLRLDTSTNPRSPWNTFGDNGTPTPSDKSKAGVGIGQAYLGWKPDSWFEMTVGRMPNPLYVTSMVWDSDINPDGAVEKFKHSIGNADLFANFGQFMYQDADPDLNSPSSDTFMLAWQVGASYKFSKDLAFKVAPVVYNYSGHGTKTGLNLPYTGEGVHGLNPNNTPASNQNGINDLLVLEVPGEFNFNVGKYNARAFGDFAYNFSGEDRARAAAAAAGLPHAYTDENKAYQVGIGFGNLGLVYGQTSKKNTWEVRTYWQHVEQYALDVNLLDSDFFEGRANLEGIYGAFAYSLTDSIIGTVRYGYASRINDHLGTGGNNLDLPVLNPIKDYNLLQLDLSWRF